MDTENVVEEAKYGIGVIVGSKEDWENFCTVLNSVKPEGEDPVDPKSLVFSGEESFPTFVALTSFTASEMKDHYEKGEFNVYEWANVEALIKIADAGYLISFGQV